MKRVFIIVLCSIITTSVFAQQFISSSTAKNIAQLYYNRLFSDESNCQLGNDTIIAISDQDHTLFYEVHLNSKLFFISAVRSSKPLLGYMDFDCTVSEFQNMILENTGLNYFMEKYRSEIRYAIENYRNPNIIHSGWQSLDNNAISYQHNEVIGPLLTSCWSQNSSNDRLDAHAYNYYVSGTSDSCGSSLYCPTGCVATAMAQIMNYWKYPVYLPDSCTQYDWCNMPDSLLTTSINYQNERNAIAKLQYDCAINANMNFCFLNLCQSFTWPIDARNALVNTFLYSSDADRKLRSNYSDKKWKNMLISNLSNSYPILYAGASINTPEYDWGGHAFVCDGYDQRTDCFHFNWGWGGAGAWLSIDSIIIGSLNYNHLERAVFDIHPSVIQDYCDFTLDLEAHYNYYYSIAGHNTPVPHKNVPYIATTLLSAGSENPEAWRIIPTGETAQYIAHKEIVLNPGFTALEGCTFSATLEPCASCDDNATGKRYEPFTQHQKYLQKHNTYAEVGSSRFMLFPNPTLDKITIFGENTIQKVEVFDIFGRLLQTSEIGVEQAEISLASYPQGMYMVKIIHTNGTETRKVMRR